METKNILKRAILIFVIMIISTLFVAIPVSTAYEFIANGVASFTEDIDNGVYNIYEHPKLIYSARGATFWCSERHTKVLKALTASVKFFEAMQEKKWSNIPYDPENPYFQYKKTEEKGFLDSFETKYTEFGTTLSNKADDSSLYGITSPEDGEGDSKTIEAYEAVLPGLGDNDPLQSIEWELSESVDTNTHQGAAYALTAMPFYTVQEQPLDEWAYEGIELSHDELVKGYFSTYEKQSAIWEKLLNVNVGGEKDRSDRGLSTIALGYQNFHERLKSLPKGYENIVQAYYLEKDGTLNVDGNNEPIQPDKDKHIELSETEIDGERYTTYKYKDTTVETDQKNSCYVLRTLLYRLYSR